MPSSLFADSSVQGDALDDQRALQIALDQLSLLGLDNDENPLYDNNQEPRKKSVNMTECVPVPSSEHVAEIVGRQGVCLCFFLFYLIRSRYAAEQCRDGQAPKHFRYEQVPSYYVWEEQNASTHCLTCLQVLHPVVFTCYLDMEAKCV